MIQSRVTKEYMVVCHLCDRRADPGSSEREARAVAAEAGWERWNEQTPGGTWLDMDVCPNCLADMERVHPNGTEARAACPSDTGLVERRPADRPGW